MKDLFIIFVLLFSMQSQVQASESSILVAPVVGFQHGEIERKIISRLEQLYDTDIQLLQSSCQEVSCQLEQARFTSSTVLITVEIMKMMGRLVADVRVYDISDSDSFAMPISSSELEGRDLSQLTSNIENALGTLAKKKLTNLVSRPPISKKQSSIIPPAQKTVKIRKKIRRNSFTPRIGLAKFQTIPVFFQIGLEWSRRIDSLYAVVFGVESYSARRVISYEQLIEGQSNVQWNTLIELHVGFHRRQKIKGIEAYFGCDLLMLPNYIRSSGSTAFGARIRGGFDLPVSKTFYININSSLGFWSGKYFQLVQADLNSFGLIPNVSIGAVFRF